MIKVPNANYAILLSHSCAYFYYFHTISLSLSLVSPSINTISGSNHHLCSGLFTNDICSDLRMNSKWTLTTWSSQDNSLRADKLCGEGHERQAFNNIQWGVKFGLDWWLYKFAFILLWMEEAISRLRWNDIINTQELVSNSILIKTPLNGRARLPMRSVYEIGLVMFV